MNKNNGRNRLVPAPEFSVRIFAFSALFSVIFLVEPEVVDEIPEQQVVEPEVIDEIPEPSVDDGELMPYVKANSYVGVRHSDTERVMLDCDVAKIYGVTTKDINRARKNNPKKFVDDKTGKVFAYQLTDEEVEKLWCNDFTKNGFVT